MAVLLDTNFILTCVKQRIDLFGQLRDKFPGDKVFIPAGVVKELARLGKDKELKMYEREAADLAVQLLDGEKIIILDLEGNVDDSIVGYALKNNVFVASLDRGIKNRLKSSKFLTIRQGRRIAEA